jgi:hypothetical protein
MCADCKTAHRPVRVLGGEVLAAAALQSTGHRVYSGCGCGRGHCVSLL